MNRRVLVVIVGILLLGGAGAGLVFALVGDGDSGDGASDTTAESTTTTAELTGPAEELRNLLDRMRDDPLHLVFTQEAGTIELWFDGELTRQELVAPDTEGVEQRTLTLARADGNVVCTKAGDADWECQVSRSVATDAGQVTSVIEVLANDLGNAEVTVADEAVGEHQARCFRVVSGTEESEICLTEDGVPVRFGVVGSQLVLTSFDRDVDESVFEPPAEVAGQDD